MDFYLILSNKFTTTQLPIYELRHKGESLFQLFCEKAQQNGLKGELVKMIRIIEHAANGIMLPKTKYRKIQNPNTDKLFEAKTKKIRVYIYHEPDKVLLILGGNKNTQNKDITKTIGIIKKYELWKEQI